MAAKPAVLITGVSGTVGQLVLEQLPDFQMMGADVREPAAAEALFRFEKIDLAEERSCEQLLQLMRAYRPQAVVHLAFIVHQPRNGAAAEKATWLANVVGTSRVIEAIAEHNRMIGGIEKFVFPSSAMVYGPEPKPPVTEETPLQAQSLAYAQQQQEADLTVQARAEGLRKSKTYILRSHFYAGAGAQNYQLSMLRGVPGGEGRWGTRLRRRGVRLPLLLPSRGDYLEHKFQFTHVGDVARLIAHIVRGKQADPALTVLNVAGRGDPLSLRRCAEIAAIPIKRLPGRSLCRQVWRLLWDWGVSGIPPEAFPYLLGSCVLDTTRLRVFLGEHYRSVMQHTSEEALVESLRAPAHEETPAAPKEPVKVSAPPPGRRAGEGPW